MWKLNLRRARHRARVMRSPLAACWAVPGPKAGTDWQQVEFLVIDTETSSLNPADGEMLSIGWVVIRNARVLLSSAEHLLLLNKNGVGQSAVIHQLRDCELEAGMERGAMMERFLKEASGRILVFHHAGLDLGFLNKISYELFHAPLLLYHLDTLALEQDKITRRGKVPKQGDLRLANCRRRYHLPDYPAHNALVDALATAELLIAQARHRSSGGKLSLRELSTWR